MGPITSKDQLFLNRCLDLARLGGVSVEPNPRVGAVVVYEGKIIGEGWHQFYGGPHAEVNAVNAVKAEDQDKLKRSTLYVSLEPCNHVGKTPACTDLILRHKIPSVVVGATDPNPKMSGKSLEYLRSRGVEVRIADHPHPFHELNRHFEFNQTKKRPYITLKWARSADGFIAKTDEAGNPVRATLSSPANRTFVHSLRASHAAILVGSRTALVDAPSLTTRHYPGPNPIKILLDPKLEVPLNNPIFSSGQTIVVNTDREANLSNVRLMKMDSPFDLAILTKRLYEEFDIGSILVEGGVQVLNGFLSVRLWDEIIVSESPKILGKGIYGPEWILNDFQNSFSTGPDTVYQFKR